MTNEATNHEVARMRAQIETIKLAVAQKFGIKAELLMGKARTEPLAVQRQVAMYLAKRMTTASLKDVATAFNRKDHGTVAHAVAVIEHELSLEPEQSRVQPALGELRKTLKEIFARHG
jgi:chromosomal replication initiator protein